jgi:hypothetical protein
VKAFKLKNPMVKYIHWVFINTHIMIKVKHIASIVPIGFTIASPWTIEEQVTGLELASFVGIILTIAIVAALVIKYWDRRIL